MGHAGWGSCEVTRTQFNDLVAQLEGEDAVEDIERVFLCGMNMQTWSRGVGDVRHQEIETPLVIATVCFPRPTGRVSRHISVHGPTFRFELLSRIWYPRRRIRVDHRPWLKGTL